MKLTDISAPDYFHKVVDCQWACPAHTPVPEYIRLIAAGRYSDAYMINWKSNVFPGILGRTCDRPCEPACRRGRVEKEPVAICRLKRVAADYKDDIRDRLPQAAGADKNGKRIALVGGGPASLTVARDLAPLGYECVGVRRRSQGRRHDAHADPEIPPAGNRDRRGMRLHPRPRHRVHRRQAHRQPEGAARRRTTTRSSSAPARRAAATSTFRAARKRPRTSISASTGCRSVSFGHIDKIGKRVIVLGGGNTAMDCCRSSRRLGGEDVKVVVRSGFEEMKASPWEKEDAMHEDIPILNYLVPKEFTHENGKLTGVVFEKVKAERDAKGRRNLVPTGEPDQHIPCDDVLVAVGQENAFPWIERDIGIEFDKWDMPKVDPTTIAVDPSRRCSSAATRRSGRRTSSGRWRTATTPRCRSTRCCQGEDITERPLPGVDDRQPEDGHPRVVLRQRHHAR